MPEYPSISKTKPAFPAYLDFQVLRRIGIDRVQELSSKLWTDYNLHDPGVTILEVLSYAITDLGYRNNFEIEDLLALNPQDAQSQEHNFFTADRLLGCNPVTELDFRKRLIDIPGVRNAWLERLDNDYLPEIYIDLIEGALKYKDPIPADKLAAMFPRLNPKGLYRVCLDLEPDLLKDACGESYRSWAGIVAEVKRVLCSYRNLCEDFEEVIVLGEEEIGLCAEIQLEPNADPEDVLVEIYVRVQAFLAPQLRFYTLTELLDLGRDPAEIFAGRPSALYDDTTVYQSNGFIDPTELAALTPPQVIHTSDLYQIIMDVSGVAAIKKLSIVNYINGLAQSTGDSWCLQLTPKYRPILGIAQSKVTFYKGNLPFKAAGAEVERRYFEQQAARIKSPRDRSELDLAIPQGSYANLADHYSIHHDFPLTYGIGEDGLPTTAPALRQAQAKQLKGYLIFFDLILANYLAQLAHIRDLFSWESEQTRQDRQRTYFTQPLTNLPGIEEIVSGDLDLAQEDEIGYDDRRNRFLDHLLGRFAESFNDYVQLNYRLNGGRRGARDIIEAKAQFLREYPDLSRDRFRAFNYCNCEEIWDTDNVSGFQKRVSRLLGIDRRQNWRRFLNRYQIVPQSEGFRFSLAPLTSKQIYPTLAAAQTAFDEFLVAALDRTHYRRLTYSYYYHYAWEVTDEMGQGLVTEDRYFPTQSARAVAFSPQQDLEGATVAPRVLTTDNAGLFSFHLQLSIPNKTAHPFTSIQKYPTEVLATLAAEVASARMLERSAYRNIRIEAAAGIPSRFKYYGYGIANDRGNLWAESEQRFESKDLRERDLYCWQIALRSNQNAIAVAAETENEYYFALEIPNKAKTQLRSVACYPTEELAWQAADAFTEHLWYLSRYATQYPGLAITDTAGNPIVSTEVELDRVEVFTLLDRVEPLLQIEKTQQKPAGYQFKLVDRQGEILLVGTQIQSTQKNARSHFYRDVLSILFEEGAIESTECNDADFSFHIVTRQTPTEILATHPHNYPTASDRDRAIERLKFQIRTARIEPKFPEQQPTLIGIITDESGNILLQENQDDANTSVDRRVACESANSIVELAQSRDNFRLIDGEDGSSFYSWELTNQSKDRILAVPPHIFSTSQERDEAIAAIQQQIDNEGFHLIEHILLRPKQPRDSRFNNVPIIWLLLREINSMAGILFLRKSPRDKLLPIAKTSPTAIDPCSAATDPYSFWISIILPYWPTRFRDLNFRQLVERTLRLEAPAHVGLKICWIDVCQMQEFETAYRDWLEQLALDTCQGVTCDLTGSRNRLIEILTNLNNIYPEGTLHDCNDSDANDNPIVLNQTRLGTAKQSGVNS